MKGKRNVLVVLVMLLGIMVAVQPVAGQPPHSLTVSGHGCVYLAEPGDMKMVGQTMHINGHVLEGDYTSDNTEVLPSGTQISILNVSMNFNTMTGKFNRATTFYPENTDGTFDGHVSGWFRIDPFGKLGGVMHNTGTFQGTGEFEGLTMKLNFGPGDLGQCNTSDPTFFDGGTWSGFIIPPPGK